MRPGCACAAPLPTEVTLRTTIECRVGTHLRILLLTDYQVAHVYILDHMLKIFPTMLPTARSYTVYRVLPRLLLIPPRLLHPQQIRLRLRAIQPPRLGLPSARLKRLDQCLAHRLRHPSR